MDNKKEIISTQIRLPADIHNYIKQEAERLNMAQNSFLIVLLDRGRKLWESEATHLLKVK